MTVCCWDGKILAADSRVTADTSIITNNFDKLFPLNHIPYFGDVLVHAAFCGTLSDLHCVLHYMESEHFLVKRVEHDVSALIVGQKYVYKLEEKSNYLIRYNKKTKLAAGSGAPEGRSAMALGLNAIDACKHAIKLDSACGGKVRHWSSV